MRTFVGWTCIALGALAAPTPFPVGLVLVGVGLGVLDPRDGLVRRARRTVALAIRRASSSERRAVRAAGLRARRAWSRARRR